MDQKIKRRQQLGMDPGTAAHQLRGDLLFSFVQQSQPLCWRCGKPLTRGTYSIEHKIPWLDSPKAKELFFDLTNIAFSHLKCNISATRKPNKKPGCPLERKRALERAYYWRNRAAISERRKLRRRKPK